MTRTLRCVCTTYINEFLKDKGIDYTIFIAEQTDDRHLTMERYVMLLQKK